MVVVVFGATGCFGCGVVVEEDGKLGISMFLLSSTEGGTSKTGTLYV